MELNKLIENKFYLFNFILFLLGWILALSGTCSSNTELSWFSLILSILIQILIIGCILLDSLMFYKLPICCCETMLFVFSILSIQEKLNLFDNLGASVAIAGFIFISLTNLYWIFTLGSEKSSSLNNNIKIIEKSFQTQRSSNTCSQNDESIIISSSNHNKEILKAKALYNYDSNPEDPNELSFKKDDILEVSENRGKWWQAKREDGKIGIVPSNYLQII